EAFPLRYTWIDLARIGVLLALLARVYSLAGSGLLAGLHLLVLREKALFPWLDHLVHTLTAKLELQRLWFHESQLLVPLFLLTCFLILSWRSAWHGHLRVSDGGDLYGRFGRASHNSLAYIANRSDVSTFIDPAGRGAITYRQVGRVALQVGAVLSAPADRAAVYAGFRAFCKAERLIPAAVALTADERLVAAGSGMRSLSIGTEAVVDLPEFASERLGKKMRWAQRSLQKRGYTVELLSAADITPAMRIRLDHIDRQWRDFRGGQAHGYCMTLGRFPANHDPHCLIAIARDATGAPIAYLTLLPGGEGYYSLDLTRRCFAAPNATIEFLLIEVLTLLRARGAQIVSLNFSTLSSLSSRRGGALLMRTLSKAFQLGSLEAFNAKFRPRWEPRFLVFPTWWNLPDVVYAVLVMEGVERMAINACARVLRRLFRPPASPLPKPVVHAEHA
ncbi:MAG TPA: DUF2156 domain-containing protein, partial [Ktedonobacterales bacterium]|nr:DUF2156 domain-containing protein [Ktedonobacterales bacterium]